MSDIMYTFLILLLTSASACYCDVVINEVWLSHKSNNSLYVELYNDGTSNFSISNFSLVIFNSSSGIAVKRLPEVVLPTGGYYTVGSSDLVSDVDLEWTDAAKGDGYIGAIALYDGEAGTIQIGMEPTTGYLEDALVFSTSASSSDSVLLENLNIAKVIIQDQLYLPQVNLSINRCLDGNDTEFLFAPVTPKEKNDCKNRIVSSPIIINELNALNRGEDTTEYVELYNKANVSVSLDEYTLVLYSGTTDRMYGVVALANFSIEPLGYFLIGSENVVPRPQKVIGHALGVNILQNGVAAVALYNGNNSHLSAGSNVTNTSLVDAVVYDKRGRYDQELLDVLTPGQMTIHEDSGFISEDESISRCSGYDRLDALQFSLSHLTPGRINDCTRLEPSIPTQALPSFPPINPEALPYIVINEFKVDQSQPFVELFDGGLGNVALDNILIALYSGSSLAVFGDPLSLNGYFTNENGLFLIGSADMEPAPDYVIPNLPQLVGCNAIAIHLSELSNILVAGSPVSKNTLLDVVLFGEVTVPRDQDLIDILTPGQEPLSIGTTNQSWSRCKGWDRFMHKSFSLGDATPKAINLCTPPPIVINEINVLANGTNQFIEIYDGGLGSQALDGLVVALYDDTSNSAFRVMDLTGYSTDEAGFFVIGPSERTNVDYVVDMIDGSFLEEGPGAVAIHVGPAKYYRGRQASDLNLVDAVVYGTDDRPDLNLLHLLMPNQHHLNELPSTTSSSVDQSISRCYCCLQRNHPSFGLAPVSPGAINIDCFIDNRTFTETIRMYHKQLRISEVKFDNDTTGGGFIEIYDGGLGGVDLFNILVDWYTVNSNGESYYLRFSLDDFKTNSEGYFIIESPSPSVLPIIVINETSSNSSEDQTFYHTSPLLIQSDAGHVQLVSVTLEKVLDAVTFGRNGTDDFSLLGSLDISQPLIIMNNQVLAGLNSIQRCYSPKPKQQLAFATSTPTPAMANSCPKIPIVINEINTDSPIIELGEYVELSSLGIPHFPINNVSLVSINGENGTVHRSLTLNGYQTDVNGLLLIGYRSLSVPRPDVPRFRQPVGWVRDGPDAIAIYQGKKFMFMEGTIPNNQYLIQKVEYSFENATGDMDMSINRCRNSSGNIVYEKANVSPKAVNKCPASEDIVLVINEMSLIEGKQFIEIWDLGNGFTLLDDFVVVLYGEGDIAYLTIPLTGYQTNQAGYLVMGEAGVDPNPHYILNDGFMKTNYGAISLYRAQGNVTLVIGSELVTEGLMDSIVYSNWTNGSSTRLSQTLTPNSLPLPSDMLQGSSSLCRCFSLDRFTMSPFILCNPSPDGLNLCPSFITDIIINEINVDLPGMDGLEFIELYDGGRGNVSLNYTTLVLYNGAGNIGRSYLALGLDGYQTNSHGFFVIGSHLMGNNADLLVHTATRGFLQNGPDAIAVYRAHVGAFPFGTSVTSAGLIDAVVYSTNNKEGRRLVNVLVPGYFTIKEDRTHLQYDESLSRCHGTQKRDPTVYAVTVPTMGRANNCTAFVDFDSTLIINEVYAAGDTVDHHGKYIELYDHGVGHTLLNGFLLVFYDGSNEDRSYYELDLSNRFTNSDGFLLIGTTSVTPLPDIAIPDDILQGGSDAVVLYRASPEDIPRGSTLILENIQDAAIYGSSLVADSSLMTSLAPGQLQIMMETGSAASRCLSNRTISMSAFISTMPTPEQINNCTTPNVVISEVSLEDQGGGSQEFIELYDGGQGSTPLDSLVLVLFTGVNGGRAYKTIPLQGQKTDENGYFLIVTSQLSLNGDMLVGDLGQSFLRNGANAIALYRGDHHDYKAGMPATSLGLLDALVYGDMNRQSMTLIRQLLQGQAQVTVSNNFYQGSESISRCKCCQPLLSSAYKLLQPSPKQPNFCSSNPPVTPSPDAVIINEINPFDPLTGGKEFIELKGPANITLDRYSVLIVMEDDDSAKVSYVVDLSGQSLDENGFLVIGTESLVPLPKVTLPSVTDGVLKTVGGAVALCRGQPVDFRVGYMVPVARIVDVLVYRGHNRPESKALSELTSDGKVIEEESSYLPGEETISRCSCCDIRTASAFMLSSPTPGSDNTCPKVEYGQTIQLRLEDADFDQWQGRLLWKASVRDAVVRGIKEECKCRFNSNYLKDDKLLNGSVIYQASLAGLTTDQASDLFDAYTRFVKKTESLEIYGVRYQVDRDCYMDCKLKGKNMAILHHPAPAVIVGVTVTVIIAVIFALAFFTYMKRKKSSNIMGSFRWFKNNSEFDDEFRVTDACQLEDLDVLSQVANSDNFVNPVRTLPSMLQASYSARRKDQGPDLGNEPISVDLEVDTSISYA
ncbi:uncharacterized protein LOC121419367 [Lytechinus variegatus]|uniref:uncharacterized protein LOC121419367 n=1 Tax=Lytechinus variegatus TaxID=7654 RepID=UPI001BB1A434|nr:uncharacterized protein LOC121419367 [Lytechinus variegatus]